MKVLVLGGGYAGVAAARRLAQIAGRSWSITLVDRSLAQTLQPRLADVLCGKTAVGLAALPYRRILPRRVQLITAEITDLDPSRRIVTTSEGTLRADRMVVALGTAPSDLGVPGGAEYGARLRSAADAEAIWGRVRSLSTTRRARVVIVGSGYTATEASGALRSIRNDLAVTVMANIPTLLGPGKEHLGRIAERVLRRQGVNFRFNTKVSRVEAQSVRLVDGSEEPADVILWAAPSEPAALVRTAFGPRLSGEKIGVDPYLRVPGFEGVYAVGDVAAIADTRTGGTAAGNAQVAMYGGRSAAENLVAEAAGRHIAEVHPAPAAEVITLGDDDAIAEVLGLVLRGSAALAVKEAALLRYLWRLGGLRLAAEYGRRNRSLASRTVL